MATITTGSLGQDLEPGVQKFFGLAEKDWPKLYERLFEVVKTKERYAKDVLFRGLNLATVKNEGNPIAYDSMSQGWTKTYEQIVYATGFTVTREAMDDGHALNIAMEGAKRLKRSLLQTLETIAANHLNRAFTSGYTGGDGIILCSASHPTLSGGLVNNTQVADLSEASLEQAIVDIHAFVDERGLKTLVNPKFLIVHPSEAFNAERILKSTLQNDTMNNAINAVRSMSILPEATMVNPYLTDSDAFFVKTDAEKGLRMFIRDDMEVKSENDFDTENAKFIGRVRAVSGWTDFRAIHGSPGA